MTSISVSAPGPVDPAPQGEALDRLVALIGQLETVAAELRGGPRWWVL